MKNLFQIAIQAQSIPPENDSASCLAGSVEAPFEFVGLAIGLIVVCTLVYFIYRPKPEDK